MEIESKIKELLAVLDMSEDEQQFWIEDNIHPYCKESKRRCACMRIIFRNGNEKIPESLADLAFRLRNEQIKKYLWGYQETVRDVCKYVCKEAVNCGCFDAAMWLITEGQPIHWIIAALIEKVREQQMMSSEKYRRISQER